MKVTSRSQGASAVADFIENLISVGKPTLLQEYIYFSVCRYCRSTDFIASKVFKDF
jgi:hypothetical protein